MANRLKRMQLPAVDLCRRGCNPDAYVKLFKSAEGGENTHDELSGADSFQQIERVLANLQKSFFSIVGDHERSAEEKQDLLIESLHEFHEVMAEKIESWSTAVAKQAVSLDKAEEPDDEFDPEEDGELVADEPETEKAPHENQLQKGRFDLTTFNRKKMSAEDRAILEALEKKYAETAEDEGTTAPEMHPDVKKALDEVEELKKSLEIGKLEVIAKKYEPLGRKADELAVKLFDLKKAGDGHYGDYVALLDEQLSMAENSIFKEYGTSRSGAGSDLLGIVSEIRKSTPSMTHEEAVIRAYETNPNLDPYTGKLK